MQRSIVLILFLLFQFSFENEVQSQDLTDSEQQVKVADAAWTLGYYAKQDALYQTALRKYYEALHIYEELGDSIKYARLWSHIGLVYSELDDFDKALEFQNRALNIYKSIPDTLEIARMLNNIGLIHIDRQDYDQALKFLSQAIKLKIGLDLHPAEHNYANLGRLHIQLDQLDSSLYYFNKGLDVLKKPDPSKVDMDGYEDEVRSDSMEVLNDLGKVYFLRKEYDKAKDYFNVSYRLAKQLNKKNFINSDAHYLSQIYESEDSLAQALFFQKIYSSYSDSIFSEKNNRVVTSAETDYEIEKAKAQSRQLVQRQKYIIYSVTVSLIFLSIITLSLIYNYKKGKKASQLIALKNEEIHQQKVNQLLNEKELNAIIENINGQEKERKRMAEELHDGIGGTLSGIKLALISAEEDLQSTRLNTIIENVNKTCQEVRSIAHNLAPPPLQHNLFVDALNEYLSRFQAHTSFEVNWELYPIEELNNVSERIQIEIYRVIQEALSNVQRHAAPSYVEVQLTLHEDYINLIIEDNGNGFETSETKHGLGIANMKSRVEMIGGKIDIDSQPARGTVINIDIQVQ